jgi:hypothetical protein
MPISTDKVREWKLNSNPLQEMEMALFIRAISIKDFPFLIFIFVYLICREKLLKK